MTMNWHNQNQNPALRRNQNREELKLQRDRSHDGCNQVNRSFPKDGTQILVHFYINIVYAHIHLR